MEARLPPQPRPDADTEAFWSATREGRLALCRCTGCALWLQPPLERCRSCAAPTRFETVAGTGSVHSFIVVRHPAVPGYLEALPYVVALVELDEQEGLRLPARLVDADPAAVRVGSGVRVCLVDHPGGDYRVAAFRLADEKAS